MTRSLAFLACASVPLLFAADPWKTKKASEWTDKELQKVLTNSPWAKTASVEVTGGGGMTGSRGGGMGRRGGGGGGMGRGGGMGGGGGDFGAGVGGGESAGGGGFGGGGMATGVEGGGGFQAPRVVIRWESAAPMQDALTKSESPHIKAVAEWSKEYYVITASGIPMMGGGRRGGGASAADTQPDQSRMRQMQQRLQETTVLTRKGKDPVPPARMAMTRSNEGMTLLFLFPRSAEVSVEDKDVSFETSVGPMSFKTKFNLKDMTYDGKLAL